MRKSQLKFLNKIIPEKLLKELYQIGYSKIGISHKTGIKFNGDLSEGDFIKLKKLYIDNQKRRKELK